MQPRWGQAWLAVVCWGVGCRTEADWGNMGPPGGGGEREATKSQSWTVFVILQRPLLLPKSRCPMNLESAGSLSERLAYWRSHT